MATLKAMFKLFDGYSSTIDKINRKTDEATNKIMNASGATDKFNKKLENTGASANIANTGLGKLVKTFISLAAIKKGIDIVDEYTNTASRLALINDGLQTQAELQDKIFAAAERARGSYSNMADAIATMGLLAKDAFKSNDELIAFTELVQKSFKIAGASTSEQQAAMRQLAQAMASGRLQGDELVSIMENAPMIYEAIAKYMGKTKAELKELSSKGAITADIIKNAMFAAADDINKKFQEMPMTFGDIWNKIKNGALKAFSPVIQKVNELINSEGFNKFINGMIKGFYTISAVASRLIDIISKVGSFFASNWSIIEPLIWGIIGALVVYNATMGIAWLTTLKHIALKAAHTVASWAETAAIFALIAAQEGLNAALAACPITWIIMSVIMLIALFYAAVAAINHFAGTTISATGLIVGVLFTAAAFVGNLFIAFANLAIDVFATIWNTVATFAEFLANVFVDPVGSIIRLFAGMADSVLGILQGIAKAIDTIFGSNLAAAVSGWKNSLKGAVNNLVGEAKIKVPRINTSDFKIERFEYSKAWKSGYAMGEKFESKFNLKNLLGGLSGVSSDVLSGLDPSKFLPTDSGEALGSKGNPATVKGTGKNGAVEVDMSDEDLKYLRDIAQREYINQFSTATLAPNITITFGDVHKEADADKVAKRIRKILQEEIAMAAEGSYAG